MQHDPFYPDHADEYARDVREWVCGIEVPEKRQGQAVIYALSGAGRLLFDGLEMHERRYGVDIPGPQGDVHLTAVELILRILCARFPVHEGTYVTYWY